MSDQTSNEYVPLGDDEKNAILKANDLASNKVKRRRYRERPVGFNSSTPSTFRDTTLCSS